MKVVVPGGGVLSEDVSTLEVGPEAVVLRLDVGEREVPRRLMLALESADGGGWIPIGVFSSSDNFVYIAPGTVFGSSI